MNLILPKPKSIYTKKQFEEYQYRLGCTLAREGIDAETMSNDTVIKTYVANYVQTEILDKEDEKAKERISRKFAHMHLDSAEGTRVFPIINEYRGHDLINTIYFTLDDSHMPQAKNVPMVVNPIIISQ